MKTTLEIPDEQLIRAKQVAAERRQPLRALLEEGLRAVLREPKPAGRKKRVRLITVKGGLPQDLDLSDREKMHEWISRNA